MYNFNYLLFMFDLAVIGAPFMVADFGFPTASYFFVGFCVMWFILNYQNKRLHSKRYKLF